MRPILSPIPFVDREKAPVIQKLSFVCQKVGLTDQQVSFMLLPALGSLSANLGLR